VDDLTIRAARPSEYALIGELTATAFADVLVDGNDDAYRPVLLDARRRARDAELLAAVSPEGDVVGTVTVGRPGAPFADVAHSDEIEVRMLAVADGYERRGVGRRLMQHVQDVARSEGFAGVALSVIATNTDAVAFYRRLGYVPVPERNWIPRADMPALLVHRLELKSP
jgi:ribosomal protein S18 acetylase RimI-like enzyme